MVHNGIEYGMMQAIAEGFDIFKSANRETLHEDRRYDLNIADIAELWRRGSVVSSWLLDLTALALAENQELLDYSGYVEDSGEGRWTIEAALEQAVPAEVLTSAVYTRGFAHVRNIHLPRKFYRRCARNSADISNRKPKMSAKK